MSSLVITILAVAACGTEADLDAHAPTSAQAQALVALNTTTHVLTITGGSGNDVATVSMVGSNVMVVMNGASSYYAASSVQSIVFYGNDGDDTFTNNTAIPCTVDGGL
ncbi:MAG TPA: hypothetical protein VGO62_10065, partial [Myxococcota bacterium]